MARSNKERPARLAVAAVAVILVAHYLLAFLGTWDKSVTFDEIAHITAGYTYWRPGDFRLQPENGNLPARLAGAPLVLSSAARFPDLGQATAWRRSNVWDVGDQFFHALGNSPSALLRRSRAVMALLGTALCLAVFLWARSLYGTGGGLAALVACAFSPMLLAMGPLATSDTCAALFLLLSLRTLWSMLHALSLPRVLRCSACLSGLALSKASAVLIIPMAALVVVAAAARTSELPALLPGGRLVVIRSAARRFAAMAGALAFAGLIVWGAVWSAYGWRYLPGSPRELATFEHYLTPDGSTNTLAGVVANAGAPGRVLSFLGRHRLFPEPYLYGLGFVFSRMKRSAFFNGAYSETGWRTFFPYCFAVKSTLPFLALCGAAPLAAVGAWSRDRGSRGTAFGIGRRIPESAPLVILLAVYWAALIFGTLNIGARHLLPVLPPTFILLGGLARFAAPGRLRVLVVLLLCGHVAEGLRAYPDYLAYFNQVVGRQHAYRHLVDSSLDWGQDLPGLRSWMDRRLAREPGVKIYVSYFGRGSLSSYGISPPPLGYRSPYGTGGLDYRGLAAEPLEFERRELAGLPLALGAGAYCVSATNLQSVYYPVRGRWTAERETAWRELRRPGQEYRLTPPAVQRLQIETGTADKKLLLDLLGTARLLAFLRAREPDAEIGYSILCFELSADDIGRAFEGPPPEGVPAVTTGG